MNSTNTPQKALFHLARVLEQWVDRLSSPTFGAYFPQTKMAQHKLKGVIEDILSTQGDFKSTSSRTFEEMVETVLAASSAIILHTTYEPATDFLDGEDVAQAVFTLTQFARRSLSAPARWDQPLASLLKYTENTVTGVESMDNELANLLNPENIGMPGDYNDQIMNAVELRLADDHKEHNARFRQAHSDASGRLMAAFSLDPSSISPGPSSYSTIASADPGAGDEKYDNAFTQPLRQIYSKPHTSASAIASIIQTARSVMRSKRFAVDVYADDRMSTNVLDDYLSHLGFKTNIITIPFESLSQVDAHSSFHVIFSSHEFILDMLSSSPVIAITCNLPLPEFADKLFLKTSNKNVLCINGRHPYVFSDTKQNSAIYAILSLPLCACYFDFISPAVSTLITTPSSVAQKTKDLETLVESTKRATHDSVSTYSRSRQHGFARKPVLLAIDSMAAQ